MSAQLIKKIEDLIVGSGATDFRALEAMVDVFCPFEAVGMIHQEIRHSNFLSYILDPNRPHGFGDRLLAAFLDNAAENGAFRDGFSRLDLHFLDFSNVEIRREWRHIDLLVIIPNALERGKKGLVLTVELKIHASESKHQLSDYKEVIDKKYPDDEWERGFLFLTKHGVDPSEENAEIWAPLDLESILETLSGAADAFDIAPVGNAMLRAYLAMARRHILDNKEIEVLARRLWNKHREALEILSEYRPNLETEIADALTQMQDEALKCFSKATGKTIKAGFWANWDWNIYAQEWLDHPAMRSGDPEYFYSGSLMGFSIERWGAGQASTRAAMVIFPGEQENREAIYEATLKQVNRRKIKIGKRTPPTGRFKYLSASYIYGEERYLKALEDETAPEEIAAEIIKNAAALMAEIMPVYDEILKDAFTPA